jgi:hypothetical protein
MLVPLIISFLLSITLSVYPSAQKNSQDHLGKETHVYPTRDYWFHELTNKYAGGYGCPYWTSIPEGQQRMIFYASLLSQNDKHAEQAAAQLQAIREQTQILKEQNALLSQLLTRVLPTQPTQKSEFPQIPVTLTSPFHIRMLPKKDSKDNKNSH